MQQLFTAEMMPLNERVRNATPVAVRGAKKMDLWSTLVPYLIIAVLAIVATIGLLFMTKIPTVILLASPSIAAVVYMLYARLDLGYWDKFAIIAFVVSWAFAFVVTFAFLGVGRLLRLRWFLSNGGQLQ